MKSKSTKFKVGYLGIIARAKRNQSKKKFWTHVIDVYDEKRGWGASPCGWAGDVFFVGDNSKVTCFRCQNWLNRRTSENLNFY